MGKKYADYMDEISADDLYKGLLAFGLFSNRMPPVFSSTSFFDYCVKNHPTFSNSDHDYIRYNLGPIDAIAKTMVRVRGSYALELMFRDYPGEIWVARKDSPMIIGVADGETYVASDVPAILKYDSLFYLSFKSGTCTRTSKWCWSAKLRS